MQEITVETMIGVHDEILRQEGGDVRLLSETNLLQLSFRTGSAEDAVAQCAVIFYSLCAYPAFREGNRRTAYRLIARILKDAGHPAELPCGTLRSLARGIEEFTVEPEDVDQVLRGWIRHQDSVT